MCHMPVLQVLSVDPVAHVATVDIVGDAPSCMKTPPSIVFATGTNVQVLLCIFQCRGVERDIM